MGTDENGKGFFKGDLRILLTSAIFVLVLAYMCVSNKKIRAFLRFIAKALATLGHTQNMAWVTNLDLDNMNDNEIATAIENLLKEQEKKECIQVAKDNKEKIIGLGYF